MSGSLKSNFIRFNNHFKVSQNEKSITDFNDMINLKIQQYGLDNVYNADETGKLLSACTVDEEIDNINKDYENNYEELIKKCEINDAISYDRFLEYGYIENEELIEFLKGQSRNLFDKNLELKRDFDYYKNNLRISISKNLHDELEFDLIECDVSIANALRRIMMSEVPTMAIEKVFITQNTSNAIPDQVIAHRLGLAPVFADPDLFEYSKGLPSLLNSRSPRCRRVLHTCIQIFESLSQSEPQIKFGRTGDKNVGSSAYFPSNTRRCEIGCVDLQELDLFVHCVKGVGLTHAKFSPVS
ncbi:DNA-directed RNA polymerases I and III subunit RPAC1-like [Octopus sinensis]|uniref:DNA-directed RNA polymerases I and III subunit RPAC1-like n=1 Tax=Octopus sinensis TaxID=2607531 RepID=A0A6P7U7L0_9MOLL|nr:DNA-directed RNA polymerases I and III subunit RPAC1-like [Octopus sinensis]